METAFYQLLRVLSNDQRIKCHTGVGPKVTGIALVADDNFSARYDLDRIKGVFSGHNTNWRANLTRIKFWPNTAKGGVATVDLHEMASRALAKSCFI